MEGLTRSFSLSAVRWIDCTMNARCGIRRGQMECMVSMAEACIRFEELMREVEERMRRSLWNRTDNLVSWCSRWKTTVA